MSKHADPDLLDEYDFTGAERGKYAERFREGTNVVKLDDDVAELFRSAKEVNDALRSIGLIIRAHRQTGLGDTPVVERDASALHPGRSR
ncbi:hypothetical protein [Candidatus Thiodictyon syntrophicum]|jgi:hypothetical protein|uniref:hypothetical protein n=1 Tax=Candidatus Thiodictyon syntrophicum TaxID=1166950 RepID=UPI001C129BD6|nr:hypothetical protein [Candidatus Thiodictyon syntrophicum]